MDFAMAHTFDLGSAAYAASSHLEARGCPATDADDAGHRLVRTLNSEIYSRTAIDGITGHNQYAAKACPGVLRAVLAGHCLMARWQDLMCHAGLG